MLPWGSSLAVHAAFFCWKHRMRSFSGKCQHNDFWIPFSFSFRRTMSFRALMRTLVLFSFSLTALSQASAQAAGVSENELATALVAEAKAGAAAAKKRAGNVLRVAAVQPSETDGAEQKFLEQTLEAIRHELPGMTAELRTYPEAGLQNAVSRHEADLFIISSGYFVHLADAGTGTVWISSLKPPYAEDPNRAAGAAFAVRSEDSRYTESADLRSAIVAAESSASFDGWIAALAEISNFTQYPKNYFGKTLFTGGSGLEAAKLVLNHEADAAVLKACELERLEQSGQIRPGSLRVIGEKNKDRIACRVSTALYPYRMLAARPHLPQPLLKAVSRAIYAMPASEDGYSWSLANDLKGVRTEAQRFGYISEGAAAQSAALEKENRYKYALVIGGLILLLSVLYNVSVSSIVARRTKTLVQVIDEKDVLEDHAKHDRERLSQLERAGIVSELSSMIAHELRQPVASLINYADGLSLYLGGKGHDPVIDEATKEIGRQAERVSSIVERVRRYAKQKEGLQREIDFVGVVKSAYSTFRSGTASTAVRVAAELPESAMIEGDPLELELLVVNTLKNALHAVQRSGTDRGEIRLMLKAQNSQSEDPRWVLEVIDNGEEISEEKLQELSHPISSDKLEGLGLGLSICRVIAARHRGRLTFRKVQPHGLAVTLSLPQLRS